MSMNEDPNMLFKTWREKLMDYIDDADKYGVHTYTCSTAPETAEKVLQGSPFDSISDGKVILVAFASDNTAEAPTIDMGLFFAPASLPPAAVKAADGGDITPSALGAGFRMLAYDYTNNMFRLMNPASGGSGTVGEDGGYYAPSVDSGGNLTWTASKAGMPQVSGANIKGPKGDTGVGIASIARTSGTGAAGTTDTYTITMTDGSTSTFTVYNGADGASGSGSSAVTSVNGKTGDVKLPVSGFGTCATAAATAIKVVDGLPEDFLVEDGVQLCVKFSNANTAAAPQLSVAGASAPIFDARTSNNVDAAGIGARTHQFVYYAGVWVLLDALMVSIPDKLPNPNALTFTGAVTGSYDGSAPLEVEIPSGSSEVWQIIADDTLSDDVKEVQFDNLSLRKVIISVFAVGSASTTQSNNAHIYINKKILYYSNGIAPVGEGAKRWVLSRAECINGALYHVSSTNNSNSFQSTSTSIGWLDDIQNIEIISIKAILANHVIGAGTRIRIMGVKT